MAGYVEHSRLPYPPRLPLSGCLDLTYRCNNNCRHCWIRLPPGAPDKTRELSLDEIAAIVSEARRMGCRRWSVSGGEPMLRSDFPDILEVVTRSAVSYSLNTNGTLITPRIARLLRAKGVKMVALYGATAEVHDHVTRNPGSFDATLRGCAYLREAGAGFCVQIIPMRDNFHHFDDMVTLAESLSSHARIGAAWLYLSACGDPVVNAEIRRQRLDPRDALAIDRPDPAYSDEPAALHEYRHPEGDDRLLAGCIAGRREFHIDPYGGLSSCAFVQDPSLRYDLRKGTLEEGWEKFIPSIADNVRGGDEYRQGCGSCELRTDCRWCPVYGYLEHRRHAAKVDYLCRVAREAEAYKADWRRTHRRFFRIADITVQVDSDVPITEGAFHKFRQFEVDGPGDDTIRVRHRFGLPDIDGQPLGTEVYRRPPWAIYERPDAWVYLGISPTQGDRALHRVVVFSRDYTRATIYNDKAREEDFSRGNLASLTLFPTDQLLLAQVLSDRQGCYLHASGIALDGRGLLFVGHSEAGKSTMSRMLQDHGEILCDDRIIVRRRGDGFKIYGTWSHGEVPEVSAGSAPLAAILFLVKDQENRLVRLVDQRQANRKLLGCLIKPFVTARWWDKMLPLVDSIAREVPCYDLHFDKSGRVVDLLRTL